MIPTNSSWSGRLNHIMGCESAALLQCNLSVLKLKGIWMGDMHSYCWFPRYESLQIKLWWWWWYSKSCLVIMVYDGYYNIYHCVIYNTMMVMGWNHQGTAECPGGLFKISCCEWHHVYHMFGTWLPVPDPIPMIFRRVEFISTPHVDWLYPCIQWLSPSVWS
jgi:hypothetical protein